MARFKQVLQEKRKAICKLAEKIIYRIRNVGKENEF